MSGSALPIGRIWIGRAGHHPLQNPFVDQPLTHRRDRSTTRVATAARVRFASGPATMAPSTSR